MAPRGERFWVNLDSDDESQPGPAPSSASSKLDFVKDVKERNLDAFSIPAPPQLKGSSTGFPEHRKRVPRSRFKEQRSKAANETSKSELQRPQQPRSSLANAGSTPQSAEKDGIDAENQQRLANMSPAEIEQAQKEIMSGLNPSLIERLLRRANIDASEDASFDPPQQEVAGSSKGTEEPHSNPPKAVSFAPASPEAKPQPTEPSSTRPPPADPDAAPTQPPPDLHTPSPTAAPPRRIKPSEASSASSDVAPLPTLDPTADSFLADLHAAYFPTLPADPAALAWMQPPRPAESASYAPDLAAVAPRDVRFDFAGALVPPAAARHLPAHLGLHHHGAAPAAAGYTVAELARLSRSALPAQRAIAFQTLGRILYRLGKGEFGGLGNEAEALYEGLWAEVRSERVLEVLLREAGREAGSGHETARVRAVEAVWLWRKGGGRWVGAE